MVVEHVARIVRAQDGNTALMRAADCGRADCVRLLLDAGADTDAQHMVRASADVRLCGACGVDVDAGDGLMSGDACHLHVSFPFACEIQLSFSAFFRNGFCALNLLWNFIWRRHWFFFF